MQHKGNFSFKDNKTTFIRQNKFNPKQGKKDFSFTPHEQLTTIACIMLLLAQHTLGAKEIPVDEALPNGFVRGEYCHTPPNDVETTNERKNPQTYSREV